MQEREEALALHAQGYNCAQCVLCCLRAYTGLPDDTALTISAGFGGGVRCGEICGAVSGAVMALGLANPHRGEGRAEKLWISQATAAFTRRFRENFGNNIRCADLKRALQPCDALIDYAVQLAKTVIEEG